MRHVRGNSPALLIRERGQTHLTSWKEMFEMLQGHETEAVILGFKSHLAGRSGRIPTSQHFEGFFQEIQVEVS